jgi:O-antigen/teichoic acid export membrane protein
MNVLSQASIFALLSIFMGIVPLGMGILYAIRPSEHRLALMRPLSLATIFAAISGTMLGLLNVLRGMGVADTLEFSRISAIGMAESLVPVFFGFGCLTVAWLCVAIGLWRRP